MCVLPSNHHSLKRPAANDNQSADPRVERALALLTMSMGEHWTIAKLARRVGMSRAVFARCFTTALGHPPCRMLLRLRMDRARELLRDTDLPLALIAPEVGYTTEFAFSRAFRREQGMPPGLYRLSFRYPTEGRSVCLAA